MKKNRWIIAMSAVVVLVALSAFVLNMKQPEAQTAIQSTAGVEMGAITHSETNAFDVKAALASRTLGNADAPVTVEEFASLSCGHCARFHKDVFPKLKKEYIDTGKIRFTYTDFPLNAPALDAAMISRCLPESRYFQFVKFLFDTQDNWAFSRKHRESLKQNAKLLGLTDEAFDSCLNNQDLRQGLVEIMENAGKSHEIKSTPSFIVNGNQVLKGGQSLSSFQKIIDPLLKKSGDSASEAE